MALSSNSTELELCYKMTFKFNDGTSKTIDYLEYQIMQEGEGVVDTALLTHCNCRVRIPSESHMVLRLESFVVLDGFSSCL